MSRNYELLQKISRADNHIGVDAAEPRRTASSTVHQLCSGAELHGSAKEEFTKLVRRLFCLSESGDTRSVVFSAVEQGCGCTWVVTRVARMLSSLVAGSVCVVDANFRSSNSHREFSRAKERDDAEIGCGVYREIAQRISGMNLWVMPSGWFGGQGPEAIHSKANELRKQFDYIIFDSPPFSVSSDALMLGRYTDGVVLILKANASRREIAQRALVDLAAAQVRPLGVVLNQRTYPLPDSLYKRL